MDSLADVAVAAGEAVAVAGVAAGGVVAVAVAVATIGAKYRHWA
jgi:hypothetical protein